MSERSENVGTGIFDKLNVSNVTSLAVFGVYQDEAPEKKADGTLVDFPFVVFQRVAPGDVLRSLGGSIVGEDDLWQVKALTDKLSSGAYSPRKLGALILTACETALGANLTLSGGFETRLVRRSRDIPSYWETLASGRRILHQGFYLRIFTE
jgi:hypothetical protein